MSRMCWNGRRCILCVHMGDALHGVLEGSYNRESRSLLWEDMDFER
jgi:hypothetical protein